MPVAIVWGLIALIVSVATAVVSFVLRPKAKKRQPDEFTELKTPTSGEGRPITRLMGRALITAPNVLAYMNKRSYTFIENRREVTLYYMDLHAGFCRGPIDAIYGFQFNEKAAAASTVPIVASGEYAIFAPDLFGGYKEKEGGVAGHLHVLMGGPDQLCSGFMAAKFGRTPATMPAFRNIASIFFTDSGEINVKSDGAGFYWGANNPYVPSFAADIASYPVLLGAAYSKIPRGLSGGFIDSDFDLNSATEASTAINATEAVEDNKGFLIEGFDPSETVTISHFDSAWTYNGGTNWTVEFSVIFDEDLDDENIVTYHPETFGSQEAASGNWSDVELTGHSSYRIFIQDFPITDNIGTLLLHASGGDAEAFDANPAHMIYEAEVDAIDGAGMSALSINTASFEAAAETLFNERFGLTMKWVSETSVEAFVQEILDHISAALYTDPRTGLLTLKLIRPDYEIGDLRVIDPSSAVLEKFERPGAGEMVNEIQVTWTNPVNEEDAATPPIQDLASIAAQDGQVVSDARNYYGVRSLDLALKLGHRDLFASSSPLATAELTLDRRHWDITEGEPFVLTWPERGIAQLVMRVAEIDRGAPKSSPIRIVAVEDVFGVDLAVYEDPPESLHVDTDELPAAIEHEQVLTLPWYFVRSEIDPGLTAEMLYPAVFAGVLAGQAGADTARCVLLSETEDAFGNESFAEVRRLTVAAHGTLAAPLAAEASSALAAFPALTQGGGPVAGSFLVIGDGGDDEREIAGIAAADPGGAGYTILRGLIDTTPKAWPAGTPFFVVHDDAIFADETLRAAGETAVYKLLAITSLGVFPEGAAAEIEYVLTARPHLPTRPADVKVNGAGFGTVDATGSPQVVEVTFATRNRLTEISLLKSWTDGAVAGEAGQTACVLVERPDGTVLATHDDVTSPFEVPAMSYAGEGVVIVRVVAKRGLGDGSPETVLTSLQGHGVTVIVSGEFLELENGALMQAEDGETLEIEG